MLLICSGRAKQKNFGGSKKNLEGGKNFCERQNTLEEHGVAKIVRGVINILGTEKIVIRGWQ